jgi:hypothetical protein
MPFCYRIYLIKNLELIRTVFAFEHKKAEVWKSGLNNHLAFFTVMLFGILS